MRRHTSRELASKRRAQVVAVWYSCGMIPSANPPIFTLAERALLRHEFLPRFGQAPLLADGIWLRTWRGGSQAGQPKVPPAVASMLARGLVALGQGLMGPHVYFTEDGYAALCLLAQDRRALNPLTYAHLRQELGLEPASAGEPQHPQGGG